MTKIASFYSFHRGTGKSTIIANLAALKAMDGSRVGIIDTGFQSPSIQILLGLDEDDIPHTLNDYLWNQCDIEQCAYDMTSALGKETKGKLHIIPSSTSSVEIMALMKKGYSTDLLNTGINDLCSSLELDYLFIDTHAGINEETLLALALSDAAGIILRFDHQDYQGTAITVGLAQTLEVPNIQIVLNQIPPDLPEKSARKQAKEGFGLEVASVIPHSNDVLQLGSSKILSVAYPDHPLVGLFRQIFDNLLG